MGDCLNNILASIDRMHRLCDKIEADFKQAAKMVQKVKQSDTNIGWHKIPPIPGWYASAMTYRGEVEGMGTTAFSESKIRETVEQRNIWYYGPLPIWKIETGKVENND